MSVISMGTAVAANWVVSQLRAQALEWAEKVAELRNTDVPQSFIAEKNRLLNSAKSIIEKIKLVWPDFNSAGLGGAVLVPIAVVSAAAALITVWVVDYNKFMADLNAQLERERREEFEKLSQQVGPDRAAEIIGIREPASAGFLDGLMNSVGGVVGAVIAVGALAWGFSKYGARK